MAPSALPGRKSLRRDAEEVGRLRSGQEFFGHVNRSVKTGKSSGSDINLGVGGKAPSRLKRGGWVFGVIGKDVTEAASLRTTGRGQQTGQAFSKFRLFIG